MIVLPGGTGVHQFALNNFALNMIFTHPGKLHSKVSLIDGPRSSIVATLEQRGERTEHAEDVFHCKEEHSNSPGPVRWVA